MKKANANKKSLMKIAVATMVAIFSLASMFAGTYAWFALQFGVSVTGSQFKVIVTSGGIKTISIHDFLGENSGETNYCFNPNGTVVYDSSLDDEDQNEGSVSLNPYNSDYKSHPILLLFGVSGGYASIKFKTDYCYLGETNKYCYPTASYATYTELENASKTNGNYYKVGTGDNATFYRYDVVTEQEQQVGYLRLMSGYREITKDYPNSTNFKADSGFVNKNYYRVLDDGDHRHLQTVYQYDATSGSFKMVYISLSRLSNPLSSVVEFNWVRFKNQSHPIDGGEFDTYALLDVAANKIDVNHNKYFKVKSDERIGGTTIYKYDKNTHSFDLAWDYESTPMISSEYVNEEEYDEEDGYSHEDSENKLSTISLSKSIVGKYDNEHNSAENYSSFCTFPTNSPVFSEEVTAFNHSTDGYNYIGIVINYNSDAMDYIFSAYLGHNYLESGSLKFVCDWDTII